MWSPVFFLFLLGGVGPGCELQRADSTLPAQGFSVWKQPVSSHAKLKLLLGGYSFFYEREVLRLKSQQVLRGPGLHATGCSLVPTRPSQIRFLARGQQRGDPGPRPCGTGSNLLLWHLSSPAQVSPGGTHWCPGTAGEEGKPQRLQPAASARKDAAQEPAWPPSRPGSGELPEQRLRRTRDLCSADTYH